MSKNNKLNVETNKSCPFCGGVLFLREMKPAIPSHGMKFRFLCQRCKCTVFKFITDKYRVSEVEDKCVIEYIGEK